MPSALLFRGLHESSRTTGKDTRFRVVFCQQFFQQVVGHGTTFARPCAASLRKDMCNFQPGKCQRFGIKYPKFQLNNNGHSLLFRASFLQLSHVEHIVLVFVEVKEVYTLPGAVLKNWKFTITLWTVFISVSTVETTCVEYVTECQRFTAVLRHA